jgi:cytidyltransferase-like protein
MIVGFEDLSTLTGPVAMVDGGFDPLHHGHVAYFSQAAKLGLPVFVSVTGDGYVKSKHPPFLTQEKRAQVIDNLKAVDFVHINDKTTEDVLRQLKPKFYVKGKDWETRGLPQGEQDACAELGIEIVYLDTVLDSSTDLLKSFLRNSGMPGDLDDFEAFLMDQDQTTADDYSKEYFTDAWRAENNDYSVETRRVKEGKNPQLITDTFKPTKAIDMGCGPGALMFLLQECGVEADGVDFSDASKEIAPKEVADRIKIGSIIDIALPSNAYDLVICREVFEHLTVLQVQKAVENLCRISSKYIYVTTRFHPEPQSLFDVTTEFHVDPTHINCMNKDMLRLMFNLQGFKRRKDLEAKMDWRNVGRVLVYEKAKPAL